MRGGALRANTTLRAATQMIATRYEPNPVLLRADRLSDMLHPAALEMILPWF